MHKLKGTKLDQLPIEGLDWVADLVYFEGPIVSHYCRKRGDEHFLCCWVDCKDDVNRWMWARVSENHLIRFENRMEALDAIIPVQCQDDFVYFVDSTPTEEQHAVMLLAVKDIPEDYAPRSGSLAQPDGSAGDASTFPILVNGDLSLGGLADIPRTFSQAYNILFLVAGGPSQAFLSHPWRGGFSAMHFYREIEMLVPPQAKIDVEKVQLASPGFIRFSLDRPTAELVAQSVELVSKRGSHANKEFTALGSYIYRNKLYRLPKISPKWKAHDTELVRLTKRLLDALEIDEPMTLIKSAPRPFEAAQIARTICSRLRTLAKYQKDGLICLPRG